MGNDKDQDNHTDVIFVLLCDSLLLLPNKWWKVEGTSRMATMFQVLWDTSWKYSPMVNTINDRFYTTTQESPRS